MSVTISNDTPMSLSNSVSYDTHDRTCYTTYIMLVTISNDTPMSLSNSDSHMTHMTEQRASYTEHVILHTCQ